MEMNSAAAHLWRPIQILGFGNPVIMHYWVDRTLIKHIFGYRTRIIQKLHVAWYVCDVYSKFKRINFLTFQH